MAYLTNPLDFNVWKIAMNVGASKINTVHTHTGHEAYYSFRFFAQDSLEVFDFVHIDVLYNNIVD